MVEVIGVSIAALVARAGRREIRTLEEQYGYHQSVNCNVLYNRGWRRDLPSTLESASFNKTGFLSKRNKASAGGVRILSSQIWKAFRCDDKMNISGSF
jgi:hypothetical protein